MAKVSAIKVKTPLLLIGGGGHCRSCIDVIEATQEYEIIGIVEAQDAEIDKALPYPVIGFDSDLPNLLEQTPHCLITVGQVKEAIVRQKIYANLKQLGAILPTIISPTAYVSPTAKIGEGTIVMHQAMVNAYAQVGDNCILNSQSLVEHDSVIANHSHISTGVKINGQVSLGEGCMIGSNSVLNQCVDIADNCIIGAGSVVIANITTAGVYKGLVK